LLIEYNPNEISYTDLVMEWTRMHSPVDTGRTKCQYRSAVWYLNETQKEMGTTILRDTYGSACTSRVEPATRFYQAEEYHQHFHAKMMSGNGGGRF
jgi:peptide-methionine (S)-S-oxide reductase